MPEQTPLHRMIEQSIARGCHWVTWNHSRSGRLYCYTVGNAGEGLPELITSMIPPNVALHQILHWITTKQRETGEALLGDVQVLEPHRNIRVRLVDVTCEGVRRDRTPNVTEFYGRDDYAVTQILFPDAKGRFPGDKGCDRPFSDQEVLGP